MLCASRHANMPRFAVLPRATSKSVLPTLPTSLLPLDRPSNYRSCFYITFSMRCCNASTSVPLSTFPRPPSHPRRSDRLQYACCTSKQDRIRTVYMRSPHSDIFPLIQSVDPSSRARYCQDQLARRPASGISD